MKCDHCGRNLKKVDRRFEVADHEDDATEGQMADYYAAQQSGEWGDWGYGEIEYYCENCQSSVEVVIDNLSDLNSLIKNWHIKASQQDDYFSKYVFEYLSFIAHLKNNLFIEETQDRRAIQALKRSIHIKNDYLKVVIQNGHLQTAWETIIKELKSKPLHNSSHDFDMPEIDRWWNSSGNEPDLTTDRIKGIVHDVNDWENMVEFWIAVRNNLFHGGKNPNITRDQFLVKYAYLTISPFMEIQAKSLR